MMFYVNRPPRSASPAYANVAALLDSDAQMIGSGTANEPKHLRFASGKQIGNLIWFLQTHAPVLFPNEEPVVRFYASVEGSQFFAVTL
jgi:hypothetical protein